MDRLLAESVSGITFAKDEILPFCDCCALAKSHEQPRSRIASKRPTGPLQKFGADIWGPVGVTSIGGFRYVFGMTDYYSAYGWVVFMKSKDEAPRALLLVLKSDPGAYVYWQGGQLICILVVYVDDMIFAFKDGVWAADFKTALGARFDIKDLGVCAWALGMAVERDWDNATLKVHQAKYIDDMVHKFNLADAYAVSTPAEVGADVPGSNKPLAAEMPYQALVGSLLYAMVATRPDIAEAVSKLCRVMAKPEERHWQAAKRVLRYLKGTKTLGLTFSGGKADGLLHGYCDADWAGDVVSRRSTTGFVFMLCGAAVSWKSQLQATVALSTAEAEYMALCAAVCEALFLRELLRELCCAQSEATVIFEDNQSCIALTRNPMTHGRSKHIAIKYHFTREKVLSGEVAIEYCPTAQMVADALTKALGRLKHAEFAMQMLGA
eukprot:jgi/Tetstr1/420538/TSEL_011628.t1